MVISRNGTDTKGRYLAGLILTPGSAMPRSGSQSLGGLFVSALKRHASRVAVISPSGEQVTYRQLDEQSTRLANALNAHGLGAGSVVAILLRNCVEFIVADLAVMKLGAAKVPLNSLLATSNVSYMLQHSGAAALITHTSLVHLFAADDQRTSAVSVRIALNDGPPTPGGFAEWKTVIDSASPHAVRREAPADSLGLIIYTGGTTGEPKGVVHRQDALVHNILSQVIMSEIAPDERMLISTPLPHSAHLLCQAGLLRGATIWLLERFDPAVALQLIGEQRLTWCFMVPTMIYKLLDSVALGTHDVSSLRTILYGASPITRPRLVHALEVFGPIFLQIYGQTEAPNFITALSKQDHTVRELQLSCGQPVLATQVRIGDRDGRELPLGEVGEVQVRSVYTLEEYHHDPGNSAAVYTDQWLHTGDLGYQNESGHLFLVDRLKDMVITGGMNVYSTEVENVIQSFPGVSQVVVIGVPDEQWGEAVTAFVVATSGRIDVDALLGHCRTQLARYKVPKTVNVVAQIPLTPYLKPDKKALRAKFWSGTGRAIN